MDGRMAEDVAVTRIFHKTRWPVARLQPQQERQARKTTPLPVSPEKQQLLLLWCQLSV